MADSSVREAALAVTAGATSPLEKAASLIAWLNGNFAWTGNDYQPRTAAEILARGHGHCGEHAKLLAAMLQELGVPFCQMKEIFLMPPSEQRQASAAEFIAEHGPSASVFGLMHNDHRWLEIQGADPYPSDSTLGAFGLESWVRARLGFGERPPAGADVLVPFAILGTREDGTLDPSRSEPYLIAAFDRVYGGRLAALPSWPAWCGLVRQAAPMAAAAFAGQLNLHEHIAVMEEYLRTYQNLRAEAIAAGL